MPPPIPRPLTQSTPLRHLRALTKPNHQHRLSSSSSSSSPATLLSTPTWSVRSLLPPKTTTPNSDPNPDTKEDPPIPLTTLHHLLRLSSLPSPPPPASEPEMLSTLHAQLHFVRAIQQVDTAGIAPLYAIRDETRAGLAEASIGLGTPAIRDALAGEEATGRCRRPRRRRGAGDDVPEREAGWDVLGQAQERAGRYFVVRERKAGGERVEVVVGGGVGLAFWD
ncbi:hypothetical protein QBC39DRAFT_372603 [Podospora conica]|nr:hypothetical protein QBC39DRAFT_372603 [Schizothecium conicum]